MFSELRKFGIAMVAANQYLDQYPPQLRSAVLAIGTHICFQLSSTDADKMAQALDGGKNLAELLRNLPLRNFVIKSGSDPWKQVLAPKVEVLQNDFRGFYERCQKRWAKERFRIEEEIKAGFPNQKAPERRGLMSGNNAKPMILQKRDLDFFKVLGEHARLVDRQQAMKFAGF